ncbi:MAG: PTS glucose transporter subunit IIA [Stomatobaculum longum]|nr:PTS glucose transporter subunit IIA [Stomatobaculum longum]
MKAAAAAQQPLWKRLLKPIGDVFVPILPAIVASGLMMGLVEALAKIPGLGFAGSDWFAFLDMVANTAFAYLPVIVAISAARVFGGNIFLGAVIGLLMIHSSLTNGWNASQGYNVWYLFGHIEIFPNYALGQINQLGYQGHVIPVILSVFCMSKIEKWFHDHVPEMLDLFITPLCTVMITALLTFMIIGPIFSGLETVVLHAAEMLVHNPLGAMVMGAIYPATVVMGLHHMYNVIEAGMLGSVGLNTWMPVASAANFAQFGACLAVGIKTRSQKTKSIAVPSALSASLGITEPAIFGVNMRFLKPFAAGMVGGAVGALVGALMGLGATAYGVTGLPGYLTVNKPLLYTVMLAISGGIAFVLTWFLFKEEQSAATAKPEEEKEEKEENFVGETVIRCEAGTIAAPVKGQFVKQEDIPDETFAQGILGAGLGIQPEEGVVYAPFDGTISSVAESKHAIGISGAGDMELLIHVGVDTVAMNGDGFEPLVSEGDSVKLGQPILRFSREKIKAAGHPDLVVVLLTNSDDYTNVEVR